MAEGISIREFARRDNCSDKLVRRALQNGFLQALPDGSLDPQLVGTAWRKSNRDDAGAVRTARTPGAEVRTAPDDGDVMQLAQAARVKEHFLAQQRRLEYEQKAGLLVPVVDVAKLVGDEYARVRTRLLALPAEQAPRLHRLKTVAEVQDVLMGLIVEALEELAGDDAFPAGEG